MLSVRRLTVLLAAIAALALFVAACAAEEEEPEAYRYDRRNGGGY